MTTGSFGVGLYFMTALPMLDCTSLYEEVCGVCSLEE